MLVDQVFKKLIFYNSLTQASHSLSISPPPIYHVRSQPQCIIINRHAPFNHALLTDHQSRQTHSINSLSNYIFTTSYTTFFFFGGGQCKCRFGATTKPTLYSSRFPYSILLLYLYLLWRVPALNKGTGHYW